MKLTKTQLKQIIKEELEAALNNEGVFDFLKRNKEPEEEEAVVQTTGPTLDWKELTQNQFVARNIENPRFAHRYSDGLDAVVMLDSVTSKWNLSLRIPHREGTLMDFEDVGVDVEQAKDFAFQLLKSPDGKAPPDVWRNAEAWKELYGERGY